jgi:DUF917 family protein
MRRSGIRTPNLCLSLVLLAAMASVGCTTNLSRFELSKIKGNATKDITRAEVAAQGSGSASSVAGMTGHTVTKVSIGGAYRKNAAVAAPTGSQINPGLHGNPRATQ